MVVEDYCKSWTLASGITPKKLYVCHLNVSPNLSLTDPLRFLGHSLSSDERFPNKVNNGNCKNRHNPLSERVVRVNKRSEEPVPVSAYLAMSGLVIGLGWLIGFAISQVIKPKK